MLFRSGNPDASKLIQAIRYASPSLQMPPTGKLAENIIADFETWVRAGAPDPRQDPTATLVTQGRAGDPQLEAMAGGAGSEIGRGGMITKVLAAERAASAGAHTVIASGRQAGVLERLAAGEALGTQFIADVPRLAARKQWLADHLQMRGAEIGRAHV